MKTTKEQQDLILIDKHKDWAQQSQRITYHERWSVGYETISQHVPSGKYFKFVYSKPVSEYQSDGMNDWYDPSEVVDLIEVVPITVTSIKWVELSQQTCTSDAKESTVK